MYYQCHCDLSSKKKEFIESNLEKTEIIIVNMQSCALIHKSNSTFLEMCGGQAKAAIAKHLY